MNARGTVGTMLGVAGVGMLVLGYVTDSLLLAAVASPFVYFAGLMLGMSLHDGCPADAIDFDDLNEKVRTRAAVADIIRETER